MSPAGAVFVIEGEIARPDPRVTWSCPRCPRVVVDDTGRRSGLMCAGHPLTGASHTAAAMRREPPASTALEVWRP